VQATSRAVGVRYRIAGNWAVAGLSRHRSERLRSDSTGHAGARTAAGWEGG